MRRNVLVIMVLALMVSLTVTKESEAQVADHVDNLELLHLIQTPTAGVLKQGQYQIDLLAYRDGGAMGGIGIGLFNRFMFGISFGGDHLIGDETPVGNKFPGVLVKYRMIEESMVLPAVTVGFDMQGYGSWYSGVDRYLYKAPGTFVSVSRNWVSDFGRFGAHLGANYNTIETSDKKSFDGFLGLDMSFNEQMAVVLEYDLGLDDDIKTNKNAGFLNAGLRMTFAQSLVLQFNLIDILQTSKGNSGINRELRIVYVETFSF